MTGLDTNVLVALMLGALDREVLGSDRRYHVSLIALAELVWVFSSVYRRPKEDISTIVRMLLSTGNIEFENEDVVRRSLDDFANGPADFTDYLLMNEGISAGCTSTLTFDRKAGRHPGFTLLHRND